MEQGSRHVMPLSFVIETIVLGVSNLRLHLMRSILTAMGIILGVAAVIIMVSLGEGAKQDALARIERLGATNIIIRSQKPPEENQQQQGQARSRVSKYGLTYADLEVLRENFGSAAGLVPLKEVGGAVLRGSVQRTSQSFGVTPELLRVANLAVTDRGSYITQEHMDSSALVAVIGSEIARQFYSLEDPIGSTIRIDQKAFTVIGVLKPVGLAGGAGSTLVGRDFNYDVHIPLTTARSAFSDRIFRRQSGSFQFSEVQLSEIYLTSPSREVVLSDARRVERILEQRHPGMKDVSLIVPYELLEEAARTQLTFTLVFGCVAGIALLVGGIGIMNIMLATVTERTREIGIRRALGATKGSIVLQFLVETTVISTIGGLIGVAGGVGLSVALERLVPMLPSLPWVGGFFDEDSALPTSVTLWSVMVAFAVAVVTGLVFGIYPARRAANQDPIVALRHD